MSQNSPQFPESGSIECQQAVAELYSYLDGTLTVERLTHIEAHLNDCGDCYEAFDFEAELKMVISRRCGTEEVPETLRIRILESLRIAITEHDGDGGPSATA